MITERVGDLLTERDLTHIAHQCNLYHTFGAGLAAQIAVTWAHAHKADKRTAYGDEAKLGTYSVGVGRPIVVNLYTQRGERVDGVQTDYTALLRALRALETDLRGYRADAGIRLGLPYRLGCGIAGGSWPKVYGIIEKVFGASPVAVVVVRRAEDA